AIAEASEEGRVGAVPSGASDWLARGETVILGPTVQRRIRNAGEKKAMPLRHTPLPGQIGRGPATKIVALRRFRGPGGRSAEPLGKRRLLEEWSEWQDSNLRPLRPE